MQTIRPIDLDILYRVVTRKKFGGRLKGFVLSIFPFLGLATVMHLMPFISATRTRKSPIGPIHP